MAVIQVSNLTKDYGNGRGVFDISIKVDQGECFGYLGPNGAGKTTTIRHLMGFSKPQEGRTEIMGMDCWENSARLCNSIGYLPGEIALPNRWTGTAFLHMMEKLRHMKDDAYCRKLMDEFELDPNIGTKQMSLGVKRKVAIVTAFMHDPAILILDEPTSGLDPIMQQIFIEHIRSEKKRGKTIFLSSHIFHEVDATCDEIAIIKDGRIASQFVSEELKAQSRKIYRITFKTGDECEAFSQLPYDLKDCTPEKCRLTVSVRNEQVPALIHDVAKSDVMDFQEIPFTLEDYFMGFYKEDTVFEGVK